VIMWVASGVSETKSQKRLLADELVGMLVSGAGLKECTMSGNLMASRIEEDGHIVADQVVVPFFGVELDGKAPGIASGVGGSPCPDHDGEADKDRRLLCRVLKEAGFGVLRHAFVHLEVAMGAGAHGVNDALRDTLTVKVASFSIRCTSCSSTGPR